MDDVKNENQELDATVLDKVQENMQQAKDAYEGYRQQRIEKQKEYGKEIKGTIQNADENHLIELFERGNQTLRELEKELEKKNHPIEPLSDKRAQEIVDHIYAGDLEEYLNQRVEEEKKKEYGSLEDLARMVYSAVDREYQAPTISNIDIVNEDETLLSKIQLRKDDAGKKAVWIKPFLKSWVRKEDIEVVDPSLEDTIVNADEESFGNYISVNDLELSLLEFYKKNKKQVFTVEAEDGKYVKYKISKRKMQSLTESLQNHSYLSLSKAYKNGMSEEDVRTLKAYNPQTEKKSSLGAMNLGISNDMNKDFMTPGKYVHSDHIIEEIPSIFKRQHDWKELKKEDGIAPGDFSFEPETRGRGK